MCVVERVYTMKIIFIIVLIVLFPFKDLAADSTFRCSGGIVSVGETKLEVSAKCGEPDRVESWEEGGGRYYFQIYDYEHERYVLPKLILGPLQMEHWTYDLGSNRFTRNLYFQNNELIRIETGEKGGQ